ncbi:MAG: hypothetical protein K8S55_07980 [Phycisphaerae bacterium]|nr:hypothetical protein [Phycisphaerae bacterium]
MELEFKPDFEEARQRWDAFWRGDKLERPLVAASVLKPGAKPPKFGKLYGMFRHDTGIIEHDVNKYIDAVIDFAASHEFLGEAIPSCLIDFGPDDFSGLLGAKLIVSEDEQTTWIEPFVEDWDDADLTFKRDSEVWQRMVECIRAFRKRCDGRLIVTLPTIQGGLDALAAVRGVQELLTDLALAPEKVHEALKVVDKSYNEALDALCDELDVETYGSATRHQAYSRGRTNVPQCDCSCMMSPAMFREFGLPSVAHMAGALDAATYHLDGPDAVMHLEAICEIDEIGMIQWQPGAGEAATMDWSELYRKINSLGKRQVLGGGGDPLEACQRIKKMTRELDPDKLFFVANLPSVQVAEQLFKDLEKLT